MISEAEALNIWRKARDHPVGVCLNTDQKRNLISRLYNIRLRHKDEDFSMLIVYQGEYEDEIWIIQRDKYICPKAPAIKPMDEADIESI